MDAITEFKRFLVQKNHQYYFLSMLSESDNINKCFALINNNTLVYRESSKLREDIRNEVVEKFKQLFGDNRNYFDTD
jgi:hypothetical protein